MRHVRVILAFAVFVCSVAPGEAASLLLKDLITNNGALVQGDKLFNDFNIQIASTSGLAFPAIDTIAVEGITRNGEHGLRFAGSLSALGQPEGGSGWTIVLNYSVTSLDPLFLIHDLTIASSVTTRDGAVAITEQVFGPASLLLAEGSANAAGMFPVDPNVTEINDHRVLDQDLSSIDVQSIIAARGFRTQFCSPCGSASISYIDQTFSQTEAVPEPGTFVLLAIGLSAACLRGVLHSNAPLM